MHNVQLLRLLLCYLEVTPVAVLHIHQQSAVIFFPYSWQRAKFSLLILDVKELEENNSLFAQGGVDANFAQPVIKNVLFSKLLDKIVFQNLE